MGSAKISLVFVLWSFARGVNALISNDECSSATIIPPQPGFPYLDSVPDFLNATESSNEPLLSCFFYDPALPSSTLFYSWTPAFSGLYDFSTVGSTGVAGTNVSPTIGIFSGSSCNAGESEEVICGFQFLRGVTVDAGTTYIIAIAESPYDFDGNRLFGGFLLFTISLTPPPTPNDACSNAIVLPASPTFPYRDSQSLARVTKDLADPVLSCNSLSEDLKTIWYQWTPTKSGVYDFSTVGSTSVFGDDISFDSFVGLYQGISCTALVEVACGRQTLRQVSLVGGTSYFIQVATIIVSAGDFLVLTVGPAVAPPPNDVCSQAQVIHPFRGVVTGDTTAALPENGLVFCGTNIERPGVWYTFTPTSSLSVVASTCHNTTNFDTKISVFRGPDCEHLECIGGNDDTCGLASSFSFVAEARSTIWILIHGVGALPTGQFTLSLTPKSKFLALVDAKTNRLVQVLGNSIDYSSDDYPATTSALNIQAVVNESVRSMRVSGNNRRDFCETTAPFAIFGDRAGNFNDAILPIGRQTVTAIPFTQPNCQGPAGPAMRRTLQVTGCSLSYEVYDSVSNFPIFPGTEIPEAPCAANIQVLPFCGFPVHAVRLVLQKEGRGVVQTRTDRVAPYFLWSVEHPGTLLAGRYTFDVTVDGIKHTPLQFSVLHNSTCPTSAPLTSAPQSASPITNRPTTPAPVARPPTPPSGTLLQFIRSTPDLSTLAAAIATDEANRNTPPFLAQILNNTRTSLTLFAPMNSAFDSLAQIAPGYLAQLITPRFGLQLFDLLAYHITSGFFPTATFPKPNLRMLAAGRVNVTTSSNNTFVVRSFSPVGAQILPPFDIPASNGLAHVVNNVLVPQFVFQNLLEGLLLANARSGGQFNTLLRLITAAGLESTLEEATRATLLAPTNTAIPIETERFLLQPGNEEILTAVLTYHVITELFNYSVQPVPTVLLVQTLQGETIVVGIIILPDGGVLTRYGLANQLGFFVVRENIAYSIDTILIPPSLGNDVPRGP